MNKKLISILILALIFILPIKVSALSGTLKIQCDKAKINAGESSNCIVTGTTDSPIVGITANLSLSSNLTLKSFTKADIWADGSIDNNRLDVYSEKEITDSFTIGTIVVTSKDSVSNTNEVLSLSDISYQNDLSNNENENSFSVTTGSVVIRINSIENSLLNLTVKPNLPSSAQDNILLDFNENTTNYDLIVSKDITSVIITPTKKDANSNVSGGGEKTLNYGVNTFKITVTSESGVDKVYTLNITRPDERSSDNNLLQFGFTNYELDFKKDRFDYIIILENNISKLALCDKNYKDSNLLCIDANNISYSDKATIKFLYNKNLVNITEVDSYKILDDIEVGENTLSIIITAENESEKTYDFVIKRKDKDGKLLDNEISNNLQTGDVEIIIVIILLLTSLGVLIYMNRKEIFNKLKKQ